MFSILSTTPNLIYHDSLNFAEHVDVIVGENQQHFAVIKNEICARSEFFKAACSDRWNTNKPIEPIVVKLPDDDPHIFDIYLCCLYKDRVDIGDEEGLLPGEDGELCDADRSEQRLARAYVLADKLRDVVSANLFIDNLINFYVTGERSADEAATDVVANNTAIESPLRKLFIDSLSCEATAETIKGICNRETIPRAFICEILAKMADVVEELYWHKTWEEVFDYDFLSKQSKCSCHQHDDLHPACVEIPSKEHIAGSAHDTSDED